MVIFNKRSIWLIVAILFFIPKLTFSQDLHYSQFYNAPHTYNPAHVGVYNGDKRILMDVRDQWRWVPLPWFTFGLSYDQKVYPKKSDNHFFSFGGNLTYDRQGASRLNLSSLNFNGTYSHILDKHNIITGGLLLGFSTRGFNIEDLTWDKQWDGLAYDGSLSSGENFDVLRIYYVETGLGLNYRYQQSKRTKFDVGFGAMHLIEPNAGFYNNEDQKLPLHYDLSFIGSIYLLDILDVQVQGLYQSQNSYKETILGALGKIYLNQHRGKEFELHIGLNYRFSGSYAPTLAVKYNEWYVGASYDVDNTEFNDILNDFKGGPEIHVRYTITDVKALKAFKICPIY